MYSHLIAQPRSCKIKRIVFSFKLRINAGVWRLFEQIYVQIWTSAPSTLPPKPRWPTGSSRLSEQPGNFYPNRIGVKYSLIVCVRGKLVQICLLCICHDYGSIKQGYLFYYSGVIIVRTRALFTKFCVVWLNLPSPPNRIWVKMIPVHQWINWLNGFIQIYCHIVPGCPT